MVPSISVCVVVGITLLLREPAPAPVVILGRSFSRPLLLRDRLGTWIPASPSFNWARRLEDALLGRRKPVNIFAELFSLPHSDITKASELGLGPPRFSSSNDLSVWFLRDDELRTLHKRLDHLPGVEDISRPRIATGEGVEASLFVGQSALINGATNRVGLEAGFFPRVRRDLTDVFASVHFTEIVTNTAKPPAGRWPVLSIQTNLDLAIRLQIPKGSGVLLLNGGPMDANGKRVGIILDPP
jgi:hypothetical protein